MRTQLNGYIVADDDAEVYRLFGYTVVAPQDLRQAIEKNPEGETLTVEINSPGGNMFAGYEMYSVLRAAKCSTESEVQSMAASAASIAMLGTDAVKATPVAQVMIHRPSMMSDGNADDHARDATLLGGFKESILNAYELKSGGRKTRAELSTMMDAETWLTAQDALAAGLVDAVLYDDGGVIAGQVMNCVGAGIRTMAATGGIPSAAELRARKDARDAGTDGTPPAGPEDTAELARLRAELELLKLI